MCYGDLPRCMIIILVNFIMFNRHLFCTSTGFRSKYQTEKSNGMPFFSFGLMSCPYVNQNFNLKMSCIKSVLVWVKIINLSKSFRISKTKPLQTLVNTDFPSHFWVRYRHLSDCRCFVEAF